MKKLAKIITAVLLAVTLVSTRGTGTPVHAASDAVTVLGGNFISFYRQGDTPSATYTIERMRRVDPTAADKWQGIWNEWSHLDYTEVSTSVPQGLGYGQGHAFVLLGGGLTSGTINPDGNLRCRLALSCAQAYPGSVIVITGGHTAQCVGSQTEAGVMKDWITTKLGGSAIQIYTEENAGSTVGNAVNTVPILYNLGITSITVLSGVNHVRRGTLDFYAAIANYAEANGVAPIEVDDPVGCNDHVAKSGVYAESYDLASIMGVTAKKSLASASVQSLSAAMDSVVAKGGSLNLNAVLCYTDGYNEDVTARAECSGFNPDQLGQQTVTVSVTEKGKTYSRTFAVKVKESLDDAWSMYRLYNPNSGEHFFTNDASERDQLVKAGWKNEGRAWSMPKRTYVPVYRLYNANGGEHHYTTDVSEKAALVKAGWKDEGIGWYGAYSSKVPVYRVYNPNAFANNHHYTTDKTEAERLIAMGWEDEGIAWYGN